MLIIGLATVVVAIVLVVLACFAIPVLIELRKALVELRQFAICTEEQIKPVMNDLHETLAELKNLTREASERVDEVKGFTEAVGETGRHVKSINSILGAATGVITGSALWLTGAKVAGRFVLDRFSKKRGK
jgi:uncharacterized protein YoxC